MHIFYCVVNMCRLNTVCTWSCEGLLRDDYAKQHINAQGGPKRSLSFVKSIQKLLPILLELCQIINVSYNHHNANIYDFILYTGTTILYRLSIVASIELDKF